MAKTKKVKETTKPEKTTKAKAKAVVETEVVQEAPKKQRKKKNNVEPVHTLVAPTIIEDKNDFSYFLYNGDDLHTIDNPPKDVTLVVQHKKCEASMSVNTVNKTITISFDVIRGNSRTLRAVKQTYDITELGHVLNKLINGELGEGKK